MGVLRASVPAVLLAGTLAVAACSSSPAGSKATAELMPQVQAAVKSATSVHMAGVVTAGSQTATIDMSFSGNSLAGRIGINGQSLNVLSLNGRTFIKLDAAFLQAAQAPALVCARVCGKYLELPAASASQITGPLIMQQLLSRIFSNKNMSSSAARACVFSPATLKGQPVLQCLLAEDTVDVAAHGQPYPVYVSGPSGEYASFSDWNAVTLPAAPSGSQVVSIPNLG